MAKQSKKGNARTGSIPANAPALFEVIQAIDSNLGDRNSTAQNTFLDQVINTRRLSHPGSKHYAGDDQLHDPASMRASLGPAVRNHLAPGIAPFATHNDAIDELFRRGSAILSPAYFDLLRPPGSGPRPNATATAPVAGKGKGKGKERQGSASGEVTEDLTARRTSADTGRKRKTFDDSESQQNQQPPKRLKEVSSLSDVDEESGDDTAIPKAVQRPDSSRSAKSTNPATRPNKKSAKVLPGRKTSKVSHPKHIAHTQDSAEAGEAGENGRSINPLMDPMLSGGVVNGEPQDGATTRSSARNKAVPPDHNSANESAPASPGREDGSGDEGGMDNEDHPNGPGRPGDGHQPENEDNPDENINNAETIPSNVITNIHANITAVTDTLFANNANRTATAQLPPYASPALATLYVKVLCKGSNIEWRSEAIDLQSQDLLKQKPFLKALIWAFLRVHVLDQEDVSWEAPHSLITSDFQTHLRQAMGSQGNFESTFRRASIHQMNDPEFQNGTLRDAEIKLTHDMLLTLAAHFEFNGIKNYWNATLEANVNGICKDALLLHGRLKAAQQPEEWSVRWYVGENYDVNSMEQDEDDPTKQSGKVAFTTRPALVHTTNGDGDDLLSRPLVIVLPDDDNNIVADGNLPNEDEEVEEDEVAEDRAHVANPKGKGGKAKGAETRNPKPSGKGSKPPKANDNEPSRNDRKEISQPQTDESRGGGSQSKVGDNSGRTLGTVAGNTHTEARQSTAEAFILMDQIRKEKMKISEKKLKDAYKRRGVASSDTILGRDTTFSKDGAKRQKLQRPQTDAPVLPTPDENGVKEGFVPEAPLRGSKAANAGGKQPVLPEDVEKLPTQGTKRRSQSFLPQEDSSSKRQRRDSPLFGSPITEAQFLAGNYNPKSNGSGGDLGLSDPKKSIRSEHRRSAASTQQQLSLDAAPKPPIQRQKSPTKKGNPVSGGRVSKVALSSNPKTTLFPSPLPTTAEKDMQKTVRNHDDELENGSAQGTDEEVRGETEDLQADGITTRLWSPRNMDGVQDEDGSEGESENSIPKTPEASDDSGMEGIQYAVEDEDVDQGEDENNDENEAESEDENEDENEAEDEWEDETTMLEED